MRRTCPVEIPRRVYAASLLPVQIALRFGHLTGYDLISGSGEGDLCVRVGSEVVVPGRVMRLSPVRANHDEVVAFPQVQEWLSPLGACAGAGRGQEQYRQTADKANKCHSAAADARDGAVDGRKDPRVQPRHRPPSGHAPHRTKDYVRFRVRGISRREPSFSRPLRRPCSCIPAPAPGGRFGPGPRWVSCHLEQVVTRATTSKANLVLSSCGRPTLPYPDSASGLTARVDDARDRYGGSAAAWTCDLAVQTFE